MAAPTSPTRDTITVEALKLAGYPDIAADDTLQLRAEDWLEEFKGYLWHHPMSRGKFKSLQSMDIIGITTAGTSADNEGRAVFDAPTDFANHQTMQLCEGTHYGVCQNQSTAYNSATLASDEDIAARDAVGREIILFVTADQETAYSSNIVHFDTSTKVATFSPAISVSAGITYTYIIVDKRSKIEEKPAFTYDHEEESRGTPTHYIPVGRFSDDDGGLGANNSGQFRLWPTPYFTSDAKPRAIKQRYFVNLMKVDLTGDLMTYIYHNWRAEINQYIRYKCFDNDDDDRDNKALKVFEGMAQRLVVYEDYDSNLTGLKGRVIVDGV